jgi:hypothetical protein
VNEIYGVPLELIRKFAVIQNNFREQEREGIFTAHIIERLAQLLAAKE